MNSFIAKTVMAAASIGMMIVAQPAAAQQVIGFSPVYGQMCNGPLGVAPCQVIQQWMAQQAQMQGIPQHLQPQTIIHNILNDLNNGPSNTNDLVGKDGFVCRVLGC